MHAEPQGLEEICKMAGIQYELDIAVNNLISNNTPKMDEIQWKFDAVVGDTGSLDLINISFPFTECQIEEYCHILKKPLRFLQLASIFSNAEEIVCKKLSIRKEIKSVKTFCRENLGEKLSKFHQSKTSVTIYCDLIESFLEFSGPLAIIEGKQNLYLSYLSVLTQFSTNFKSALHTHFKHHCPLKEIARLQLNAKARVGMAIKREEKRKSAELELEHAKRKCNETI